MSANNVFVSGPKFTKFFLPIYGMNVVDQVLFGFSLRRCILETFCYQSRSVRWTLPRGRSDTGVEITRYTGAASTMA